MRRSETERELPSFDLKAARESKRLNQEAAAELLCCTQSSIARWESEGSLPLIYRRYWALYWKHHKPARKTKAKQRKRVKPQPAESAVH